MFSIQKNQARRDFFERGRMAEQATDFSSPWKIWASKAYSDETQYFHKFACLNHIVFDSRAPNRKRIIRTRLKRHNFGIFRLVIFARRQPCCIFRTKICSKFYPFQVTEFWENGFLVAQGKNGGNPCRIAEYFNTAKKEIRLSKSEFGLLPFGYPRKTDKY